MKWLDFWGEFWTGVFLFAGLILSLVIDAAIVNYIIIFLCGIIIGRQYHIRKHKMGFTFFLISFGFLLGYMVGAIINDRGYALVVLILFIIGCWTGDYIMERKYCN